MSCCGPQNVRYIYQCPSSGEGTTYTFENVNVTGQGVFSGLSGTAVQFKGIASSDASVTVTNDAGNKVINLAVNTTAVVAAIPDSTTTVKGKTAYATDAESIAKASTTKALTASNLAALGASTTFQGLTRLATIPEAETGTATDIAVTPAGLDAVASAIPTQRVFANLAARTAAVPDYVGQVGVQQDTFVAYIGTDTVAGAWDIVLFAFGGINVVPSDTIIDLENGDLTIQDSNGNGHTLNIYDNGALNFTASGKLFIQDVAIPANSVVTSNVAAGQVNSKPINQFISTDNVTDVYTLGTYTTRRTVPNAATATTEQTMDVVCTLLSDLIATLKPTDTV